MQRTMGLLLAAYFAVVLLVGAGAWWRTRSGEAHAIAGHHASLWRVAASLFTLLGGGELVTMVSLSYSFSYAAMWFFGGITAGFLTLAVVAHRVRTSERVSRLTGLPDFFREYFGPRAGTAATVVVVLAFGALLMIQYIVGASMLATFLGWPYPLVVLAMSATMVIYLSVGGYEAVLNTDVLQAIVMIAAAVLITLAIASGPVLSSSALAAATAMPLGLGLSLFALAWLAVVGGADLWQIVFAAKSTRTARAGLVLAGAGFAVYGMFLSHLGNLVRHANATLANPDDAFTVAINTVLPDTLKPIGIILVFAAVMSTADTEIFVVTRAIVRQMFSGPGVAIDFDREKRATQAGISYVAITGALLAIFATHGSLPIIYFSIVGLALALSPPMIAAWRYRAPDTAVAVGVIGAPVAILGTWGLGLLTPMNAGWVAFAGTVVCMLVTWAIHSILSRHGEAPQP